MAETPTEKEPEPEQESLAETTPEQPATEIEPTPEPAMEPTPAPKRRGRPPGSRNKPRIIETPVEREEPAAPVVLKEPEVKLFTREQVQELLLNSCRLQEQRIRDEKRERYAALFRKQKWTQG